MSDSRALFTPQPRNSRDTRCGDIHRRAFYIKYLFFDSDKIFGGVQKRNLAA